MAYRYILQKYAGLSSRFVCPNCGHKHTFTKYIDTETNLPVDDTVGICDRAEKCGYHYTPQQFFANNKNTPYIATTNNPLIQPESKKLPPSYISPVYMADSMKDNSENNFIRFLYGEFEEKLVKQAIHRYNIGSSNKWAGATVFWQVDMHGRIRSGKIMLYNVETGKRIKKPYNHITWVHKSIPGFNLSQCLFGEHLLMNSKLQKIGVVESEKTAIICSMVYPEYNWLACGQLNGIKSSLLNVCKGYDIVLFPDTNGYTRWIEKAMQLPFKVKVSDFLEKKFTAGSLKEGLDLADYILHKHFRTKHQVDIHHE